MEMGMNKRIPKALWSLTFSAAPDIILISSHNMSFTHLAPNCLHMQEDPGHTYLNRSTVEPDRICSQLHFFPKA